MAMNGSAYERVHICGEVLRYSSRVSPVGFVLRFQRAPNEYHKSRRFEAIDEMGDTLLRFQRQTPSPYSGGPRFFSHLASQSRYKFSVDIHNAFLQVCMGEMDQWLLGWSHQAVNAELDQASEAKQVLRVSCSGKDSSVFRVRESFFCWRVTDSSCRFRVSSVSVLSTVSLAQSFFFSPSNSRLQLPSV